MSGELRGTGPLGRPPPLGYATDHGHLLVCYLETFVQDTMDVSRQMRQRVKSGKCVIIHRLPQRQRSLRGQIEPYTNISP